MITFQGIGYMGRLGNQMFQFASTLGVSKRLGLEARFPIENCYNAQMSGPYDPQLGHNMGVKCDLMDCFDISTEYFVPSSEIPVGYVYHERDFGYNSETESMPDFCSLHGYFQTEKYFMRYGDLILSQFDFKQPYKDAASEYIESIRNLIGSAKIASIHVRRGDYVMSPDHHPVCSMEYYQNSISRIKQLGDTKFIVFSDDTEWCRSIFSGDSYIISDLNNPYIEMCAMSMCDDNIIANSSFSWWAAWLNTNKDKTIIAPSRWFGPLLNKNTSDIYCKNWIKI